MDIDVFRNLKSDFEKELTDAISPLFDRFVAQTGVHPSGIKVVIVDTMYLGEIDVETKKYCIQHCEVDLGVRI